MLKTLRVSLRALCAKGRLGAGEQVTAMTEFALSKMESLDAAVHLLAVDDDIRSINVAGYKATAAKFSAVVQSATENGKRFFCV